MTDIQETEVASEPADVNSVALALTPEGPPSIAPVPAPETPHSLAVVATRISGTWLGIIIGSVVLALLLVFVLQNLRSVKVSFFTASGNLPLGLALVFAAVGGVMLAAVAASLRILQMRRRIKSETR